MGVAESWKRIEAWLKTNAKGVRTSLRVPAIEGAAAKLQTALGTPLPADYLLSAGIHDGQRTTAEHGLFPLADEVLGPMHSCRLLQLTEVGKAWAKLNARHAAGEFKDRTAKPGKGVRADWWNPRWVPVADDGGGDFFCLDLAPARGGTAGQVIVYFHDTPARPRLAPSFGRWLKALADGFTAGRYAVDDDEGIVEVEAEEAEEDF